MVVHLLAFCLLTRMCTTIKSSIIALTAIAASLASTCAQFVRPPTDLISKQGAAGVSIRYKTVPTGICETRSNVSHLSGYSDVGDSHLHSQFFETRNGDPTKAPLSM